MIAYYCNFCNEWTKPEKKDQKARDNLYMHLRSTHKLSITRSIWVVYRATRSIL